MRASDGLASEETILDSGLGYQGGRRGLDVLLAGQELLAEDRHVAWRLDAQADLSTINIDNRNADIVVDVDLFTQLAAQYQHFASLLQASPWWSLPNCIPQFVRAGQPSAGLSRW